MYKVTSAIAVQRARSLAYAQALAVLMYQLQGTQATWKPVVVTDTSGRAVARFGWKGWNR